ncbi:biotin carboxylase [Streptomyces zagrosensis]|uniref:Biotin carboxylase n=2 Tax=Streptomyces zagrosensis TaxID=1042984 RepID=A0A7W9UZ69_9ACTN|nr:ATP-grasp domain-containing protein [Streptomyces zagrosensis]MBB5936720.1 biotin carboxylase [Streptomyces zagrosensis]
MSKKNIVVIGMNDANLRTLREVPGADDYRFHGLFELSELQVGEVSMDRLVDKATGILDSLDGGVDAIIGYWDFPVSALVPILSERYGTRGTSLLSVAKCEHKYWSRLEQREAIAEYPRFGQVDLTAQDPQPPEGVRFPMWVKPAVAYSSELAFGVSNLAEFHSAVAQIRAGIGRVGRPFTYVLDRLDVPPAMTGIGGEVCLAEETLTGIQVAAEGYVHEGEVTVYGVLDSINYPDSSCFLRHQYPSTLPEPVLGRLRDVSARVVRQLGFDNATFSIEFFYDPRTDTIKLLEINPRHSQSHAVLFQYVDGAPNHHCMISLALGKDPDFPYRKGRYRMAAKWYYRWFADGVVRSVPSRADIERIEREIPGVRVCVLPQEGQRLSDAREQDSYSYEVAHIITGGDSEQELRAKYDHCVAALNLSFDGTAPGGRAERNQ